MDDLETDEVKQSQSGKCSPKIKWTFFGVFIGVIVVAVVVVVIILTKKEDEEYTFSHNISYYKDYMEKLGQFITVIQMKDGAILDHRILSYAQTKICPYFSCTAAEALLAIGNESYYQNVKNFCEWYFKYMNINDPDENILNGSMYDYYYQLTSSDPPYYDIQTKKARDSDDSYAALFISLLKNYAEITKDYAFLEEHSNDIKIILSVLTNSKILNNGLTYAKTDYKIKYTMDNSEVYSGFKSAEWIYRNVFRNEIMANEYANYAKTLNETYESTFWKEELQAYTYFSSQSTSKLNLSNFYADGVVQLTTQLFDLIDPLGSRSQALSRRFNETFPKWVSNEESTFPWGFCGRALAKSHFWKPVEEWLEMIKEKYVDTGFKSGNFYSAEIGHTILILKEILNCKNCKFAE